MNQTEKRFPLQSVGVVRESFLWRVDDSEVKTNTSPVGPCFNQQTESKHHYQLDRRHLKLLIFQPCH